MSIVLFNFSTHKDFKLDFKAYRNSKTKPPEFSQSEIVKDGTVIGKTYKDPKSNTIRNEIFTDPVEKARQDKINQYYDTALAEQQRQQQAEKQRLDSLKPVLADYETRINSGLGKLDVNNPEFQKAANERMTLRNQQFSDQLNELYNPMLKNLREDTASRFGTLASSTYTDSLNELDKNRTKALADAIRASQIAKTDEENNYLNQQVTGLNALVSERDKMLGYSDKYSADIANKIAQYTGGLNTQREAGNQIRGYSDSASKALNDFLDRNYQYNTATQNSRNGTTNAAIGAGGAVGAAAIQYGPAIIAAL